MDIDIDSPICNFNDIDYRISDSITDYVNNVITDTDVQGDIQGENIQELKNENNVLKKLIQEYVIDIDNLNKKITKLHKEYDALYYSFIRNGNGNGNGNGKKKDRNIFFRMNYN